MFLFGLTNRMPAFGIRRYSRNAIYVKSLQFYIPESKGCYPIAASKYMGGKIASRELAFTALYLFSLNFIGHWLLFFGLSSIPNVVLRFSPEKETTMKFSSVIFELFCVVVQAQKYDFVPKDFSIHNTTQFLWTDAPLTWLTGINVVGLTNPSEIVILPLADSACSNSTSINGTSECIAWTSNGTALFGGPYATGLVLGHQYFISLGWVKQNDSSTRGLANSSDFDLVNAVVTSTVTALPSATATSTSSSSTATSQGPSAPTNSNTSMSTGAMVGIALATTGIALAIAGGLFFLYRRSKAKRSNGKLISSSTPSIEPDRSSGTSAPTTSTRMSMSQNNVSKVEDFFKQRDSTYGFKGELAAEAPQQRHELDSTPFEAGPTELDGSVLPGNIESASANKDKDKHTSVSDAFGGLGALLAPRKRASSSFGGSMFSGSGSGNTDGSISAGTREQSLVSERDMTPAQLYALEEEERRIDDAIRESERLVELKVQRASVQVRINAARMSGIAGAP
ncbi:hypothetical protein N431DRAFT_446028 [Stipitochalara longipes BDJ]|nr:hypothetical protein N431DRAFT_446028 [Stipitochalara longipes BDJ]